MKGLIVLGKKLATLFVAWRPFIPKVFVGTFVILRFISIFSKGSFLLAFEDLAKQLLAAEVIIREQVELAIAASPEYSLIALLTIVNSLFMIWFFIKWVSKAMIGITGSQAVWGAYFFTFFIFAAVEVSVVKVVDGSFGFIPIKDGLWFLLMNINPVVNNVGLFSWLMPQQYVGGAINQTI